MLRDKLHLLLLGSIVGLMATVPPAPGRACQPIDHFQLADAVVVGKIISVRQKTWRVLFWGANEWQAEVATQRRLYGRSPARFTYSASDETYGGCVGPGVRPRVGDVLVFPLEKVDALVIGDDGSVHERPNWKGRYAAYDALPETRWREFYGHLYPYLK